MPGLKFDAGQQLKQAPRITVGLPVFNGERWLRQAISSLLGQTYRDFALIISDNASTDGTAAICEEFARADDRIRYFRQPCNVGVFRNYDSVFLRSESPLFKWASANDVCAPTFLEECHSALEANPAAVMAYPRTVVFKEDPRDGAAYDNDLDIRDASSSARFKRVLRELRLNNAFNGLIRADALRKTSLNKVYLGSDIVLLAELALLGQIVLIPRNLFFRRIGPTNVAAHGKPETQRLFYAPEARDVFSMSTWDFHWHCLTAVLTTPMGPHERMVCAAYVARSFWWKRWELSRELGLRMVTAYKAKVPSPH
jgi:hypothetical protein